MYEQADRSLIRLRKQFVKLFNDYKSQLSFDELNVLKSTKELYKQLQAVTEREFYLIAIYEYARFNSLERSKKKINQRWVRAYLNGYNPLTKYVFNNEATRKQERLAEGILSGGSASKEIKTALNYWYRMVRQYAIEVSDEASVEGMIDSGITKVRWNSVEDEKVCKICDERDGRVYSIDKLPVKPHWNCRCYYTPVKGDK